MPPAGLPSEAGTVTRPDLILHPDTPFPIGVEYYRAPAPRPEFWDGDFARLSASGFHIVRSASYWNWMEPRPGQYELDDVDLLFDLAEKHNLYLWLDVMLGTHGAGPEWLTREHPDIVVVNREGQRIVHDAHPAYPQGACIHCYDHPAWREYGGALLRHVVNRYKDRPNMLIWGLWDGVNLSSAWTRMGLGYPCYCENTLARYKSWLRDRFTLDELNDRLSRRYRRWEDVEPPRAKDAVVEMLLFRRFHYENLAGHLRWMVDETAAIDPGHEVRSHGGWSPRPWDEICAPQVDSWGMSMPSSNLMNPPDAGKAADRAFAFEWSRALGRGGRWWNEEIYAGMSPGGVTWKKQSDPRALTILLWMTLAHGAAGSMFWQYRPEYMSFESPGYNLIAPDGEPTERFEAVVEAVAQIDGISEHLPFTYPPAEVAIVNHQSSQELFGYNGEDERFVADVRGVFRTLWNRGVPTDIVTPAMDWSRYKLLFLPNVTLMEDDVRERIERTLADSPDTRLVAEGTFGMYSPDGQTSYRPPEGLADLLGVRVADVDAITGDDITAGCNVLETDYGAVNVTTPCGYAKLQPSNGSRSAASLNGSTVAVSAMGGRFTWFGLTLSAGFGDTGNPAIVEGLLADAGVCRPVEVDCDGVVPVVRNSRAGGRLVFLFNLGLTAADVRVSTPWQSGNATDLLSGESLPVANGSVRTRVEPWRVGVLHFP